MKQEVNFRMQELLSHITHAMQELRKIAVENEVERIEFMGGYMHFGTSFDQEWSRELGYHGGTYEAAVGGPVFNNEYWSASSFECWPSREQREWMWGTDPNAWRRTGYEEE